ncbi:MAG: MCE family protein [Actinobacteria bacterium]|nr:MCE family protein [Actinomycetota bacterium]
MNATLSGGSRPRRLVAVAGVAFLLAAAITGVVIAAAPSSAGTRITAHFGDAVDLYPHSDVRILGVRVGSVDSVQPHGKAVTVTMTVNSGIPVPAKADAVIVSPSIISGRYIQLIPAYTGGPQLRSGATIPQSRTATPVEIDQLYAAITKFSRDLGPNGVNANGALNDVIKTGAANLAGSGKAFGTMIRDFSQLQQTLASNKGNFFGTITNLAKFSQMLQANNGQVQLAQQQLAQVSSFLAADRQDLAAALNELATALGQVQGFIQRNRAGLTTNITKLQAITKLLVNQQVSLAQSLDNFPLAADNFLNAYDPSNGTLDGRGDLNEISMGKCSYITNPNQTSCPTGSSGSAGSGQSLEALPLPVAGAPTGTGGAP